MRRRRKTGADRRWHFRLHRAPPAREQRSAFGRGFKRLCDHDGDRRVGGTNPVVLQEIEPKPEEIRSFIRILRERRPVRWRDRLDNAPMGLCGRDNENGDATARAGG